jgi:hypothetical protein
MESIIKLLATDKQSQILFDNYCVKLMEFKGDKEIYPEMDMNSNDVHQWRVTLRHKEELGKLRGVYSFEKLVSII